MSELPNIRLWQHGLSGLLSICGSMVCLNYQVFLVAWSVSISKYLWQHGTSGLPSICGSMVCLDYLVSLSAWSVWIT